MPPVQDAWQVALPPENDPQQMSPPLQLAELVQERATPEHEPIATHVSPPPVPPPTETQHSCVALSQVVMPHVMVAGPPASSKMTPVSGTLASKGGGTDVASRLGRGRASPPMMMVLPSNEGMLTGPLSGLPGVGCPGLPGPPASSVGASPPPIVATSSTFPPHAATRATSTIPSCFSKAMAHTSAVSAGAGQGGDEKLRRKSSMTEKLYP